MPVRTPRRQLHEIRIVGRVRRDMGDLVALAASIRTLGLLHPIVIRPDGRLVAGRRRLEAWRLAYGSDRPIPVHVVDLESIANGEYDENVFRKDLTPSELVALMRELTPLVAVASRFRQAELGAVHGGMPREVASRDAQGVPTPDGSDVWEKGRTRDKVARHLGVSAAKLHRASVVVKAAEEQPDLFGHLQEDMDRTGNVNGPYRRLVTKRQAMAIRAEPPPLPNRGPYRVIAADPPWPFDPDSDDQSERAVNGYPLMTYEQIEAMGPEVLAIAHDDCALWLWTTNHHLPRAFDVLAAWGFEHKTVLTWGKDKMGCGHYLRGRTEHCLLAVRGRPTITMSAETTLLLAPRREHSEKPGAFYDLVERVTPAPRYAELYSHLQAPRPGWDRHSSATPATPAAAEAAIGAEAAPRTVPDLVRPGDVVRTSYGSGPSVVVHVTGPHPGGRTAYDPSDVETWSLGLAGPTARRTKGCLQADAWINGLLVDGGRLISWGKDEIFVEQAIAAEATA